MLKVWVFLALLSLNFPRLELQNQYFYLNILQTVQAERETVRSTGGIFQFTKQQPHPRGWAGTGRESRSPGDWDIRTGCYFPHGLFSHMQNTHLAGPQSELNKHENPWHPAGTQYAWTASRSLPEKGPVGIIRPSPDAK